MSRDSKLTHRRRRRRRDSKLTHRRRRRRQRRRRRRRRRGAERALPSLHWRAPTSKIMDKEELGKGRGGELGKGGGGRR